MIESVFTWRKVNSVRDLDFSKDPDHVLTSMYFRGQDLDGKGNIHVLQGAGS